MSIKLKSGLYSLVGLQYFTVFPEYFISVSVFYVLIVVILTTYNIYVLMLQRSVSQCLSLILLMCCYLIYNDDLIYLSALKPVNYSLSVTGCYLKDFVSFNNSIKNDFLGFFAKFLICFFSSIYFLLISDSLKEQKLTSLEYLLVLLLAIIGLLFMCNSYDFLTAYLAIELSSLAFYILASFRKTSSYSIEAGIKYFITGAVSSAFFLLGSSIIYGTTGSIHFVAFYDLYGTTHLDDFPFTLYTINSFTDPESFCKMILSIDALMQTDPEFFGNSFLEIGLAFILFSIFIKLSAAPFHLWSLDVYEGSPTNSTIFFAVITKLSLFVLLIRICYMSFFLFFDCWQHYTLLVGVFSIFVGSFAGLKQRKLKTLIAYSSTSHMGYSLVAFSTGTFLGVQAIFFYMIAYMISGLCMWSIILALRVRKKNSFNKYNKELGDLTLLRKSNPSIAFSFALNMFSVAGIPPMLGFLAKMSLFLPVVGITYYSIALTSILISVVSTFYYIRVIKVLYFENVLVGELYYPVNGSKTIILSFLVFLLIFLFVNPTFLYLLNYKTIFLFYNGS